MNDTTIAATAPPTTLAAEAAAPTCPPQLADIDATAAAAANAATASAALGVSSSSSSDNDPIPKPHLYRRSDGHQVFPIWRTILELQPDDCTADAITNHLQQQQRTNGWPLLDRSAVNTILRNMTSDGLLLARRIAATDISGAEDGADHVAGDDDDTMNTDEFTTFELPVVSGNTTDDGTATEDDDDDVEMTSDTNKALSRIELLPACLMSRKRDAYCYECQHAGAVLSCGECSRVFHADCARASDRLDMPLLALREPVPDLIQKTFQLTFDMPFTKSTATPKALHADARTAGDPLALRLCVRCRLLKRNAQHLRPLTAVEELNDLLRTSFKRIRSWLANDTFSTDEPKSIHIPNVYVQLLLPVLMAQPRTIEDIAARINDKAYRSLLEYRTDVMDVLHCVGVLRGTSCAEYEAAKYLQLDATHDTFEMARCQDCFMQSGRQRSDPQWFIRPCEVPHQLVFAKMPGFSYWPAKVMRQLRPRLDGSQTVQFDVRFFGKDHSRALIPERFIVPDGRPVPGLKRTVGMKRALDELAAHKERLQLGAAATETAAAVPVQRPAAKRGRGRPAGSTAASLAGRKENSREGAKTAAVAASKAANTAVNSNRNGAVVSTTKPAAPKRRSIGAKRSSVQKSDGRNGAGEKSRAADADSTEDEEHTEVEETIVIEDSPPTKRPRSSRTFVGPASSTTNDATPTTSKRASKEVEKKGFDVQEELDEPMKSIDNAAEEPEKEDGEDAAGEEQQTEADGTKVVQVEVIDEEDDTDSDVQFLTFSNDASADITPPRLAAQEPVNNHVEIIESLRREMDHCEPYFVSIAVEALRKVLAVHAARELRYEEHIAKIKRMQWCYTCLKQAKYYCCWRVSYCSPQCQQANWKAEHKNTCRRIHGEPKS